MMAMTADDIAEEMARLFSETQDPDVVKMLIDKYGAQGIERETLNRGCMLAAERIYRENPPWEPTTRKMTRQ